MLSIGVSLPQVQEYRCPQLTHPQRKQRRTGTKIDRCKGLEGEQRNRIERDRGKKQKKVSDKKGFVFVSKLGPASERPQLNAAAYKHWIRWWWRHRWRRARENCEWRGQLRAPSTSPDDLDQREDFTVSSHTLRMLHTRRLSRHAEHQTVSSKEQVYCSDYPLFNSLLIASCLPLVTTPMSDECTLPSSSMRSLSTNPMKLDSSCSICQGHPRTLMEMRTVSFILRVALFLFVVVWLALWYFGLDVSSLIQFWKIYFSIS